MKGTALKFSERKDSHRGQIIVVSAPSGAGKTSICKKVLKQFPELCFSVSYTTRPPREGEEDGKDYRFISREEFKSRIEEGAFAEWAENYGHFYGTAKDKIDEVLENGQDILFDIDPQGAKQIKQKYEQGVFVFVLPPSIESLRERLMQRVTEADAVIQIRLARAMEDIKEVVWYDYVIINEEIKKSIEILKSIYIAEKNRRERLQKLIDCFIE